MRGTVLFLVAMLGCAIAASGQEARPRDWPKIASLRKSFTFLDLRTAEVELPISGLNGQPLYMLECHNGDYEDPHFNYSGDFECRLTSTNPDSKEDYTTLLTYAPLQTQDWESRARFFLSELEGKCGSYPEYGRVRNFRLRGMRLTLSLAFGGSERGSGRRPGGPFAATLRVEIRAAPDPTALSQIAEDVPYRSPLTDPSAADSACGSRIPKHVAGNVTRDYIRAEHLGPPFPEVAAAEKIAGIPPRQPAREAKFPEAGIARPEPSGFVQFLYLPILTTSGTLAYEFECSSDGPTIGRSGMRCGLYREGTNANLLDDAVDPYTRMSQSRFLTWQLYGKCAGYPEWGAVRHFRLRGMKITVELRDMRFDPEDERPNRAEGRIKGARVRATVEPDPQAKSPVALAPRILDWEDSAGPRTCAQVLIDPRKTE